MITVKILLQNLLGTQVITTIKIELVELNYHDLYHKNFAIELQ